jgi:hypothetical protein
VAEGLGQAAKHKEAARLREKKFPPRRKSTSLGASSVLREDSVPEREEFGRLGCYMCW